MIYRTWHFSCGLKTNRGVPRGPHGPRNETHQPYPLCQSITPKCPVNQPLCLLPRVDADFGHILSTFLDKSPQLEGRVTNGVGQTSAIWRIGDGLTEACCHRGLTYKSWSSTNPGDNPQIHHLKYKIQITTQNMYYKSESSPKVQNTDRDTK